MDSQLILIGRELSTAGDALLEPIRAEVRRRIFPALRDAIRIEVAGLADAPAVGAATFALRELFEAPLGKPAALPTQPTAVSGPSAAGCGLFAEPP